MLEASMSGQEYFDDENKDSISDGWSADHKRMLAIDRNRNGVPDDYEWVVKKIETEVKAAFVGMALAIIVTVGILALLGWLVGLLK
jgi:hypothetical protein